MDTQNRSAETILDDRTTKARAFLKSNPGHPFAVALQTFITPGPPRHIKYDNLLVFLWNRYQKSTSKSEADGHDIMTLGYELLRSTYTMEAISSACDPVKAKIERANILTAVAQVLTECYYRSKNRDDLEEAISLFRQSIELRPAIAEELIICRLLTSKFELDKDYTHIADIISYRRSALTKVSPTDVQNLQMVQSVLASAYQLRYKHLSIPEDSIISIGLARSALETALTAQMPPEQISELQHILASCIHSNVQGAENPIEAANETVKLLQEVVASTPQDSPQHPIRDHHRACAFAERFLVLGELGDVDRAIEIAKSVLDSNPHLSRQFQAKVKDTIGASFRFRYGKSCSVHDLDQAIRFGYDALELDPERVDKDVSQIQVAVSLWARFNAQNKPQDLEDAMRCLANFSHSSSSIRVGFSHACLLARIGYQQNRFQDALSGFRRALDLLPRLLLLGRDYRLDLFDGTGWTDLAVDGAACSLECGDPRLAVEILEHGRSIGWTRGLHMRGDFDKLLASHPDHAQRLTQIGEMLEKEEYRRSTLGDRTAVHPYNEDIAPWEQSYSLSQQWDMAVASIRKLDDYHDFLLPLKYEQLRAVGTQGLVVVVNISKHRCDALVIAHSTPDRPQVIPLARDLWRFVSDWSEELRNETKNLASGEITECAFNRRVLYPIVRDLWREVVQPVSEALSSLAPYARRVWWCPTGDLTFLPLHLVTRGYLPDRFARNRGICGSSLIPSYTTTVTSLLRAQLSVRRLENVKVLAVSCTAAIEDLPSLPGASEEMKSVLQMLPDGVVTYLTNEDAKVNRVLSGLADHSWVHFACHGFQSREKPYLSHFVLNDGRLHTSDIVAKRLPKPQFAFLSACHTATGVPIPAMYDEAMHLAAGLQFVGFRGIIASMWAVDDDTAPRLIREVYRYLYRNANLQPNVTDAAEALYRAIRTLRQQGVLLSRLAPFIHMGI